MPKSIIRSYSHYNRDAVALLGKLIRSVRKERKLTVQEVADRSAISRGLLQRIEKGDLKCEIGAVFEVATLLGIQLFHADSATLHKYIRQIDEKLTLLPRSIRKIKREVDNDF
jgi:transcriptional regulator with XRE-family HTH domain